MKPGERAPSSSPESSIHVGRRRRGAPLGGAVLEDQIRSGVTRGCFGMGSGNPRASGMGLEILALWKTSPRVGSSGVPLCSIRCFFGLLPAISNAAGFSLPRFGLQQSSFFSGMLQ